MKKTMFTMAIALTMAFAVQAQDLAPRHPGGPRHDMSPEKMVKMRVERLDKELNLTAEQKQQITDLFTEEAKTMMKNHEKMRELQKESQANMESCGKEMQENHEKMNQKLESLLTPEQKEIYAKMKSEMPQGHHGNHHMMKNGKMDGNKFGRPDGRMKKQHEGNCSKHEGKCEKPEVVCEQHEGNCDKHEGNCGKHEGNCDKHEGNCDKHEGNCDKHEGKCEKHEGDCKKSGACEKN
ncbi:MAG: Spy/CpxP family protein refolding chaperone [Muribaculaceae bacterium]|nr:Spy/CpxP family protein refolding chaperone [Muribaculaceae bacterium]